MEKAEWARGVHQNVVRAHKTVVKVPLIVVAEGKDYWDMEQLGVVQDKLLNLWGRSFETFAEGAQVEVRRRRSWAKNPRD